MERAVVHRAIAKERHGNLARLEQLEAVARPGRLQDARPHDAAGAHEPDFRREEMHAAAASPRATGVAAEELGDEFHRRQALGQRVAVSAMRAEDDVVCAQMRTDADGDGFLPDVGVASPVDQPALMAARQLLLALPDELHGAIPRKHLLFGRGHYCPPFAEVGPTEPPLFMARLPPSIGISAPVIQLALSEARKTARPLMSSGWPRRPVGMPLRYRVFEAGVCGDACLESWIEHLRRKDGVHPHAAAAPFRAQLAGHLRHRAHRHAVADVAAPQRRCAGQRTDIDNAAASGCQHAPARFLTHAEAPQHQVSPRLFDIRQRDLFRASQHAVTRHIAEEVDAAKFGIQPPKQAADLLRVRHIAGCDHGPPTIGFDEGGRLCCTVRIPVHEHQIGSGLCQCKSHGTTEALSSARDEGDFTVEIE